MLLFESWPGSRDKVFALASVTDRPVIDASVRLKTGGLPCLSNKANVVAVSVIIIYNYRRQKRSESAREQTVMVDWA